MEDSFTTKDFGEISRIFDKDVVEINESDRSPKILLDKHQGILKFSGRVMPDNVKVFFEPVIEWIQKYLQSPKDKTYVTIDLEYFNSSASKVILQMILILKKLKTEGKELIVKWYFMEDDDDMLDSGKTFEDLTGLKFEFICY